MEPEERQQLEALADDLYACLVGALAAGRQLPEGTVRELVDGGPYHGRSAVEAGLADACRYPDEIEAELAGLAPGSDAAGASPAVRPMEASVYHALRVRDAGWHPLGRDLPRVAYVVARGAIRRGRGPRGIACDELRELLGRLQAKASVRAVVLRLETPGGDALASDLLWRAVSLLSRDKPVVVSMGEVVASGGYYLAVGAPALFAEAATTTGSIGVVGGQLDLEGLYQRLGVGREAITRGARAGLLSGTQGLSAGERRALRRSMTSIYRTFAARVAEGRGLAPEAVERVAQGRVWSGARARELGLVDALGGPLEALAEARRRAGLSPDEPIRLEIHPRAPRLAGLSPWLRLPE